LIVCELVIKLLPGPIVWEKASMKVEAGDWRSKGVASGTPPQRGRNGAALHLAMKGGPLI
jgi:hypothetical protein